MENIKTTIEQVTEGLTAHCEYDILPVYYGGQLMNGAAYTACRFKRFALAAGHFTTEAASRTVHATVAAVDHVSRYGGTGYLGEV